MSSFTCYSIVVLLLILFYSCQGYPCVRHADPTCHLYPLYQQLEAALINSLQTLHTLKQTFLLPQRSLYPLIAVTVYVRVGEMRPDRCSNSTDQTPAFHSGSSDNNSSGYTIGQEIWDFQWSSSALLSLITADELLSFDNTLFVAFYSTIGPGAHFSAIIELQVDSLPCTPTKEDMTASLTTLLTWVSRY